MKINLDDPNLTAFALGELSGAEKNAMEKAVAASAEAQARVEELQALARLVRGEFRRELQQAAEKPLSILPLLQQGNFWSDWRWASLAVAALLAICAVVAAVALSGGGAITVAEKQSKATRPDTIVQMETDPTSAELLASDGALSSPKLPSSLHASAEDGRSGENPFSPAASTPVSTFPIQVETASYAKIRRSISSGSRPPKDAVQIDQMINYFSYDYPPPEGDLPFSINLDAATCPWQPGHQLVRIGLKGREIPAENRGASNLVFLLDVSGSMQTADRLTLVKSAMRLLVGRLTENDRVAIVVYAGASGVALPSTGGDRKEEIVRALEELKAADLTDGIEGIELAYRIVSDNFIEGGVNRVILATDGELNVGVASEREFVQLAKKKARAGLFLTVLGVGDDSVRNAAVQKVAAKGNADYAHLDSVERGRKILGQQINDTLVTIAKDVEVQVEFNPARVTSYRLIGYESRALRREDFNNDKVDAGEIGAGHTVTALYEVIPVVAGSDPAANVPAVDPLKYQAPATAAAASSSAQMLTVKLRHKEPAGDESKLAERTLMDEGASFAQASADFRFAAAVAEFGMILRASPHKGSGTFSAVLDWALEAKGSDATGYRAGFVELVRKAQGLGNG
ncbi:MAG: von Willebrand factor type A domain-containing protein [Verrucomicrobiota bacterium]|nr:von Willebrand factor type A domain-containing protein [Verrucomicrobiota bacterium]